MQLIKNKSFLTLVVAIGLLTSCKKSDNGNPNPPPPTTTAEDRLKDTVLLYTKDIYLWYTHIPSTFNARSYGDPDKIMTAIRNYSTEPGFTQPVDRWSFAVKQVEWDSTSSGITQDFGFNVFFRAEGDLRVRYVERASPAGLAGVRRGWQITKINGSTDVTTSNANYIVQSIYYNSTVSLTFKKPDGNTVDVNLTAASYQEHPIFLDTVYTSGSKKIGYLVFNSFLGDTIEINNEFQRIFSNFATQNVNDVIVDLRYNGGGYVSVQDRLANYLVASSSSGQTMMIQKFNDKYTQYDETTIFNKLGSLNLPRVFFIVSNYTASASELLINNLNPHMDVKLVGQNSTYGKPVGYFPIPVGAWYIFPVSFRSTNKNGEGNYFNGFAVDNQTPDGLDRDWGDINEESLASAIRYITTGAFRIQSAYSEDPQISASNKILDAPLFKGLVDTKKINF